ncbi:hypothetical protein [Streptomyces sp. NPDC057695]|uniref:hypothetical protein n=1 Tax=Streptomyces sp. NPDC057695 TaxID=3346217 RepID=UPI0036AF466D
MIARFAPIIGAGFSTDWEEVEAELSSGDEFVELLSRMADPTSDVGIGEVDSLLESLEELLDLFDEEPMGNTYYPFKAAELIELHGRMATGDLPDDAPVPLSEWVDRFAKHVDWQLEKSGIDLGRPDYFAHLERTLRESDRISGANDGGGFADRMVVCRERSAEYISALSSALR